MFIIVSGDSESAKRPQRGSSRCHSRGRALCALALWLLSVLIFIATAPSEVQAQAAHILERMQRIPGDRETVLQFELDSKTQFTVNALGQRILVRFERTAPAEGVSGVQAGGDVVQSRVARIGQQTEVTVILRRAPEDVETLTSSDQSLVRVALRWSEQGRWVRPGLTNNPGDRLTIVREGGAVGRYLSSEYSGQWDNFFQTYSAPVAPWVDMQLTLAPYAVLAGGLNVAEIDALALRAAKQGNWEGTVSALTPRYANATSPSQDTLAARGLLATGAPRNALARLERLPRHLPPKGPLDVRVHYLYLHSLMALDRHYQAYTAYHDITLPEGISPDMRLYWRVLGAELGLKTGQPQEALAELDQPPLAGVVSVRLVAARRVQALYDLGRREEAWQVSRRTELPLDFLRRVPAALERYADLLYGRGKFAEAMRIYNALADSLLTTGPKAMALWRMGMSLRYSGRPQRSKQVMSLILDKWPHTAAGYRARVVRNDIAVMEEMGELKPSHVTAYEKVMSQSPQRKVRGEAAFKRILVMRAMGEKKRAVRWLSDFLVAFGAGNLQNEARVLMGSMLPSVVRSYLDQGDYVRGLALVAEHRDILVHTDMPHPFLETVGDTFERLGLYERAARVFLYMLAQSNDPGRRELLLPRTVRLWRHVGDPLRAAEYADMYLQDFPNGDQAGEVIAETAATFLDNDEPEKALDWLLRPQRPYSRRLDVLTARALYALQEFNRMGRYLERATLAEHMLSPRTRYIWADGCYQLGQYERVLPLWRTLFDDPIFGTRALYKAADSLAQTGRYRDSAKLYTRLADETDNQVWRKMAEESRAMGQVRATLAN
ncbi:hypothetical protein Dret_0652 [Desulfohalobium retbaense DSM 5692]|uniref:Tetratricopeptide repeat protein n=2 Tax=Desulfohalobium TaxID=45662 RepID=C8X0J7_DESRD|nr:hypothetical protein Dret_0652 [Desulfohalobium retbaense DSM 5692]